MALIQIDRASLEATAHQLEPLRQLGVEVVESPEGGLALAIPSKHVRVMLREMTLNVTAEYQGLRIVIERVSASDEGLTLHFHLAGAGPT